MSSLSNIESSFSKALKKANSIEALEDLRVSYFGKKGELTLALRSIGSLPASERPEFGQKINETREKLTLELEAKIEQIQAQEEMARLEREKIDITLPGRLPHLGSMHPLRIVESKVISIFRTLGFKIAEGPEVETDYYNFEALNFPLDHPSRDMQDTLFCQGGGVLRTHMSPVQVRVMENFAPPLRVLAPGRVYRHDSDRTHSPVFHQIEGLCVGEDIHFGHLKGTLEYFVKELFGPEAEMRFRPSFFPFTEPSAEMDMAWGKRKKGEEPRWMEILGCGMVDPNVFLNVGKEWEKRGLKNPYDPERVSGFAFGLGIERMAMVYYGIDDIRLFYENDVRFLEQFGSEA